MPQGVAAPRAGRRAEQDEYSWVDVRPEPRRRTVERPPRPERPPSPERAPRRTVKIEGRGAERHLPRAARRPPPTVYDRATRAPDRIALYAVLLGIVLVLVAATSSHAAALDPHALVAHLHAAR